MAARKRTASSKKREPLNPERIATAALAYIDEHGLEAMSVRNLGAVLSVEGMALYKHFPSKEAILDAVAELLVLELVFAAPFIIMRHVVRPWPTHTPGFTGAFVGTIVAGGWSLMSGTFVLMLLSPMV